jgi:multiple sugar transport system substrate-binding protein
MRRRTFLQGAAAVIVFGAGACGAEEAPEQDVTGKAPSTQIEDPSTQLSGSLKILLWSHFVPRHDKWFDKFAMDWGKQVGVEVTVDHIEVTAIPARIEAELAARSGHDVIQFIGPLPQFEPSVVDLKDITQEAESRFGKQIDLCKKCSLNPTTGKYYAYAPGWVPDPGNARKSLWEQAGLPNGPTTWDELLNGGSEIKSKQNVQLGIGMSQEIDSNMVARSLIWSFGGAEQDEQENVTLNSPETIAAVEYMKKLYEGAMTDEVFGWNPSSNNQGLVGGKMSYVVNSISAYRTLQKVNPQIANDVLILKALDGPDGSFAAQHVMYNWLVPKHAKNVDAAKEFLLHYTQNYARALRLPGLRRPRAGSRRLARQRPVRLPAAEQARRAEGRSRVEQERGLRGLGEHGDRRDLRHVHHPEHVRRRRPRQAVAEGGGRGGGIADAGHLREVAQAGPDRRRHVGPWRSLSRYEG